MHVLAVAVNDASLVSDGKVEVILGLSVIKSCACAIAFDPSVATSLKQLDAPNSKETHDDEN